MSGISCHLETSFCAFNKLLYGDIAISHSICIQIVWVIPGHIDITYKESSGFSAPFVEIMPRMSASTCIWAFFILLFGYTFVILLFGYTLVNNVLEITAFSHKGGLSILL